MKTVNSILKEKQECYYYYEGKKVELKIASDKLLIGLKSPKSQAEKESLLNKLQKDSTVFDTERIKKNLGGELREKFKEHFSEELQDKYLIAYLDPKKTENIESEEIDRALETDEEVSYLSPLLYGSGSGDLVGLTDEVLVELKKDVDIKDLANQLKDLGIKDTVPMTLSGDGSFLLVLEPKNKLDALEVANILFETGKFEYATPSFFRMVQTSVAPNDNLFANQTYLNQFALGNINIENAWNVVTGVGIRIAIMDAAILTTHQDLQANIVAGYDPTGQPIGFDTHGTQVAGVAGAVTDNTIGVAGASWNSTIIPVRVGFTPEWGSTALVTNDTWVVNCFNECRTNLAADVINCSFSLGTPSSAVTSAIDNAAYNGRSGNGCVICVATGNNFDSSIRYPSSLPSVIAVGATDVNGFRADFSNYGSGIDLAAPGTGIVTTDRLWDYTDFGPIQGTSFASPLVAGAAALVLATGPQLNSTQVRQILCRNAAKTGGYNYVNGISLELGFGRLNVYPAIQDAIQTAFGIDGANWLCDNEQATYSLHNFPFGMSVAWSAVDGLVIDSNTGTATAQLPIGWEGSLAKVTAQINNGITIINTTRRIPIGAYQGELFAQGRVALPTGDINSWAPAYGFIQLQNNNYNQGVNYINFGYAPYINETTDRPPQPGQTWFPGGITGIQVLDMPYGWVSATPYLYTLSVGCLDASGHLVVNLLTPCGWCYAVFFVSGFN